jgi:cytochrome d ubiquinol oxidase subunit I
VVIAFSGAISGVFVVCANAWMNTPAGFRMVNGAPVDIDLFAAMFNPAAMQQGIHMTIAAYLAIAFAAAGIHAFALLRDPGNKFHRHALAITLAIAAVCAPLQLVSGDFSAKMVARWQPLKLAALEGQWRTERGAPLRIGGLPDERAEVTRGSIEIPGLLSWLAHGDTHAEVRGLTSAPRADRPPVTITHVAFQIMVACGTAMIAVSLLGVLLWWRKRALPVTPWYLRLVMLASPLGLVAIEAGWTVTEVGRQPWIVYGVMRTADAVTPMPGLIVPLVTIALLYLFLAVVVVVLLRHQVFASPGVRE